MASAPRLMAIFYASSSGNEPISKSTTMARPNPHAGSRFDDFLKASDASFQAGGFDVQVKKLGKVGTHRSCNYVYKGALQGARQGNPLKFMALAVESGDRVFLLTGTSLEAKYDKYEPIFKDCLSSFSFDK